MDLWQNTGVVRESGKFNYGPFHSSIYAAISTNKKASKHVPLKYY